MKFRKKSIVIDAERWEGGSTNWLDTFCGRNWTRADAIDMAGHDDEGVVVYNSLEKQWLHVPVGHWLIRGIKGERTYEPEAE